MTEAGAPVARAQVELFPRLGASLSTVSDSTGGFRYGPIRPGTYRLEVRADGWPAASTGLRVERDRTVTITVRLSRESASDTTVHRNRTST